MITLSHIRCMVQKATPRGSARACALCPAASLLHPCCTAQPGLPWLPCLLLRAMHSCSVWHLQHARVDHHLPCTSPSTRCASAGMLRASTWCQCCRALLQHSCTHHTTGAQRPATKSQHCAGSKPKPNGCTPMDVPRSMYPSQCTPIHKQCSQHLPATLPEPDTRPSDAFCHASTKCTQSSFTMKCAWTLVRLSSCQLDIPSSAAHASQQHVQPTWTSKRGSTCKHCCNSYQHSHTAKSMPICALSYIKPYCSFLPACFNPTLASECSFIHNVCLPAAPLHALNCMHPNPVPSPTWHQAKLSSKTIKQNNICNAHRLHGARHT